MSEGALRVLLRVEPAEELDPEAAERVVRRLRAEIAELDVESVATVPAGAVPAGAKGADPVTMGAVVVALSASGGVLTGLVALLRDWLGRQPGKHRVTVTIDGDTIELERVSAAQQQALVDAYIRRHSGGRAE
jgi:hypothetical protein